VTAPVASPIGVMDSGVGGLSVLLALRRALPAEDLLYVADNAWFPYGERDPVTVRERSVAVADWLRSRGAKAIVVACNTATATALEALRQGANGPVLGVVEPGAREAVRTTRNRRVGLLATSTTIATRAYERAVGRLDPAVGVTGIACPTLATAIETVADDGVLRPSARSCAARLVDAAVDTVILGCTHYAAARDLLAEALPGVALVTAVPGICRDVAVALRASGLARDGRREGRWWLACSGDPDAFALHSARFAGTVPHDVVHVDLGPPGP
jgi:glutamate racemase